MTWVLVQRGSGSSSSSQICSSGSSLSSASSQPQNVPTQVSSPTVKSEGVLEEGQEHDSTNEFVEHNGSSGNKKCDDENQEDAQNHDDGHHYQVGSSGSFSVGECIECELDDIVDDVLQCGTGNSQPPPPSVSNSNLVGFASGTSSSPQIIGPSVRTNACPVTDRTAPSGSQPSLPRSHCESDGYNSADEQTPCFSSSIYDIEQERQFEIDIRRAKGFEVKRMMEDGNCLFRAVADLVYGDSELYDMSRQMCIDYMEQERDHFSQFITEGFTSYCSRKRKDKVYGNNVEIQALSEMYNRPIHIYSYSTEPINIFHGNYDNGLPPIRLSYHRGHHYNALVDPRRLNVGAGLGFSCLRGINVDKDQVKTAIKAQQDQQIDNALLAEGQFFSDLELTEKEIERTVMEASRAEYFTGYMEHIGLRESSTSGAEPSSSGAWASGSESVKEDEGFGDIELGNSMQMVLSMGFSYEKVIEAYTIFGDDVDSMVCYLLETGSARSSSSSRRKGKATDI